MEVRAKVSVYIYASIRVYLSGRGYKKMSDV